MSTATHEVHLAIYDLSMGMARGLSAQFLGPQHAVDIIPHTAIIVFGKEYYFGQGIEWCSPNEFRSTRGIHPIETQPLGHTTMTVTQFESWCRAQAANGSFGPTSYDLFHRNCNNFSEEAARQGLRLQKGVPPYILEMPQKVLQSPMGMALRPMLEQMQIANTAPTNLPSRGNAGSSMRAASQPAFAPNPPIQPSAAAANPWANIPAASSTPSTEAKQMDKTTPLLDKQTALLSTDTGVVKICIERLKPDTEKAGLLSKLADTKAQWKQDEINTVHQYLRSVIENDMQHVSYALMLLRLVVLKQAAGADDASAREETSQSTQLVANLLFEGKLPSLANQSMAWCVLSNAMGSTQTLDWNASSGGETYSFIQLVDKALCDSDPAKDSDGASSTSQVSLRQSAAAFLYNSSRYLTTDNGETDLSEGMTSILLGCLEHLHEESDVTVLQRLYMAIGQLLKSTKSGETAKSLVNDLGLFDEEIAKGKKKEVQGLAKEVAALLI